jgi:KDO2-lipid IV(A) lauroyltransferase
VVRYRRTEAERRIREVFGDTYSDRDVRRIAWISLRNTFFNQVELMRVQKMDRAWFEESLDYTESSELFRRDKTKGGVLALVHTGNWDLAGIAARHLDLPIVVITGVQRNPLVDRFLNRLRRQTGMELIARNEATMGRTVLRRLKDARLLAILTDLRSRTPGLQVEFLGGTANLAGGMAMFAWQARVPVYPVLVTRVGWTRHAWEIFEPIQPERTDDKRGDWQRLAQKLMHLFEGAIRKQPEQFFWYNKRWVLDPLESALEPGSDEPRPPG